MKKIFKALALALAGAMFMVACDDTPAPYNPHPGGGEGGKDTTVVTEKAITCAEAVELCGKLTDGAQSVETYVITGYITDVFDKISNNQQSFWLADTKDGGKLVQAFWANLPEGVEKFTVGSKVTITGKLLKYVKPDGTVITEVKNPIVVIKEQGGGDEPGTEATKVTCAKAVELCNALADNASSAETYAVTGYITDVFGEPSRNQQSFWIADTKDGGKVFNAFYANLPEGVEKFVVGSKVTITGKLLKYVKADGTVTPEIKNADVTIHEVGGGDETPDQPIEGTPAGTGVENDPYNVAGALAYIQTLSAEDKPEALVYTKGVISEVVKLGTSGSIQFKMQDKNVNNSLLVYYCNNLGNVPFKAQTDLKKGDEVIVCGKVVNYAGNTPEYNAGAYLVSLNGKTEGEGGGSTPGGEEKPGEVTEFSIDLAYSLGANAYDNGMATINGVEDCKTLKIGTAKAAGTFTLTMPAGKHTFYAVAWKGTASADVTFSNGDAVVKTVKVKGNTGATGNAPYTLTVTDADKYEIELAQDATITVTSDKRIIFFGIK